MAIGQVAGGRFELEALAGAGAMGEVYRAKDSETGGRVAVKIMPGRNSEDSARFLREAQILSTLAHPHIVSYVKHGVMGAGDAWLAMEWLDGEDLAVRLAQGALSVVDTVTLGLAMADALGFVHERRISPRCSFSTRPSRRCGSDRSSCWLSRGPRCPSAFRASGRPAGRINFG